MRNRGDIVVVYDSGGTKGYGTILAKYGEFVYLTLLNNSKVVTKYVMGDYVYLINASINSFKWSYK